MKTNNSEQSNKLNTAEIAKSLNSRCRRYHRKQIMPWIFISPFLILFLTFTAFPIVFSAYLSFQDWNPVAGLAEMKFVGLDNYLLVFGDPWFWKSVYNTIWLAVVSSIPQHLIAIPVAYVLVTAMCGSWRRLYTTTMFMPFITSTVAISLVFFTIYSDNTGILNQWLLVLSQAPIIGCLFSWVPGVMPIRWLSDSNLIKPSIAFVVIWKYTGFNIVIYSVGYMTVSKDLYNAAKVDGCNPLQQFWHVALPMIRPFVFFAFTLSIIGSLQLFEEPFVLTAGDSGGVAQSGLTVPYYLYLVGWEWLEMGQAAAISWLLFSLIAVATFLHFYINAGKGLRGHL